MVAIANDRQKCERIAQIMKALGHPVRLRIIALLVEQDLHVGAIAEAVSAPQAVVSQQLGVLRMRGLVKSTRDQGRAVYHLAEPRLRELVSCMEGCDNRAL